MVLLHFLVFLGFLWYVTISFPGDVLKLALYLNQGFIAVSIHIWLRIWISTMACIADIVISFVCIVNVFLLVYRVMPR
jgi:hypothetical protein